MLTLCDFDIPWEEVDKYWWGYIIQFVGLLYSFIGLSIVCDDHMVPALETLCHKWGIGDDVAGATFMAFGSAAPEMIINVVATIQNATADEGSDPEATSLGVSAIIGSGMIAFSLIPAACGLFAPGELYLKRRPLFRDEFFYLTSMAILVYIMFDNVVHSWEAGLLVLNYSIYLMIVVFGSQVRKWYFKSYLGQPMMPSQVELDVEDQHVHKRNPRTVDWKSQLRSMDMEDFIAPFEKHDYDTPELWETITIHDFNQMGINRQGRIAKFRAACQTDAFKRAIRKDSHRKLSIHSMLDKEDHPEGCLMKTFEFVAAPCYFLFEHTCIDCEVGSPGENWYLCTFFVALFWVSCLSFMLASVVQRWVDLSGVPMVFFGLILVSLGAEIPDTIASVSISKKGHGSMAVANCQGTQVINICLGLGLPWLFTSIGGAENIVNEHLVVPAGICVALIGVNMSSLLGHALCCGLDKAVLNRTKSYILIATYFAAITTFGVYLRAEGEI